MRGRATIKGTLSWINGKPLYQSDANPPSDPLTLLTMMEEVLERSQGIFDFNPEAQVNKRRD